MKQIEISLNLFIDVIYVKPLAIECLLAMMENNIIIDG